jgi:hypothetical protein
MILCRIADSIGFVLYDGINFVHKWTSGGVFERIMLGYLNQ